MKKRKTIHIVFSSRLVQLLIVLNFPFLRDCLVICIEKEFAAAISTNEIIEAYDLAASRRAKFKLVEM
jgi:hypothetical protein